MTTFHICFCKFWNKHKTHPPRLQPCAALYWSITYTLKCVVVTWRIVDLQLKVPQVKSFRWHRDPCHWWKSHSKRPPDQMPKWWVVLYWVHTSAKVSITRKYGFTCESGLTLPTNQMPPPAFPIRCIIWITISWHKAVIEWL